MSRISRTLPALWLGFCLSAAAAVPLLVPSGPPKVVDLAIPPGPPPNVDVASLED